MFRIFDLSLFALWNICLKRQSCRIHYLWTQTSSMCGLATNHWNGGLIWFFLFVCFMKTKNTPPHKDKYTKPKRGSKCHYGHMCMDNGMKAELMVICTENPLLIYDDLFGLNLGLLKTRPQGTHELRALQRLAQSLYAYRSYWLTAPWINHLLFPNKNGIYYLPLDILP